MTVQDAAGAETAALVEAARAFAEETAAPAAAAAERTRSPDRDLIRAAAALGLTAIQVPKAEGGLGLPFAARAGVAEALSRACYGVAMAVINSHNAALRLARLADAPTRARLIPGLLSGELIGCTAMSEPGAGSDFAAISTTARRDGAGWILDGEKAWVTNARAADLTVLFAQTGEIGDARGVAGFLVETARDGVAAVEGEGWAGLHAMGLGGFRLEGYRAPAEALLLPPGPGFRAALAEVNGARVHVAAMCCGMVDAALDAAADWGAARRTFGAALADHQGWRAPLARAEAELSAARLLVTEAARVIDAGADAQLAAAKAKLVATDLAARRLPEIAHALGAQGLGPDSRMARFLLGAQGARLADGSSEMMMERIARLSPRRRG